MDEQIGGLSSDQRSAIGGSVVWEVVRRGGYVWHSPFEERSSLSGRFPPAVVERVRRYRDLVNDFVVRFGRPEPEGGFTVDADAVPELLSLTDHILLRLRLGGPQTADELAGVLGRDTRYVKAQITRLRNAGRLTVDDDGRASLCSEERSW